MDRSINLEPIQFVYLMFGFAATLIIIWLVFWIAIMRSNSNPTVVINNSGFLRIVTVGFTLSAVVILSLARILTGEIAGAIVSGIVGYVLGSVRSSGSRTHKASQQETRTMTAQQH